MKTTEKVFENLKKGKKYTDQELALYALGLSEEEVADVLDTDRRIDKGEKLFDLPKELEEGAKKARMSGNCNGYAKTAREKKVDRQKRFIIDTISRALTDHLGGSVHEITNPEREILVECYNRKFKIVLSCPRTQWGQLFVGQKYQDENSKIFFEKIFKKLLTNPTPYDIISM